MKKDGKNWNSVTITQFELSKILYTSGFLSRANLTATSKLVLIALIQHYNANNAEMFPSQKFLSKQLGISEKSVERAIANLSSENYISYTTQKVNKYRFTAHFFEQVKMSVDLRQNVGSDDRQNVGQTNKEEQKKKKDFLLNFAFENGENSEPKVKNVSTNDNQTGDKSPYNSFLEEDKEKLNAYFEKNRSCKNSADGFQKLLLEKNISENAHQKTILDSPRDEALAWVRSLSPFLRVRGLAKLLTSMHNFTHDELWGCVENPYAVDVLEVEQIVS